MNAPTAAQHLIPEVNQREVPAALIDALKAHFGHRRPIGSQKTGILGR
jgi:D-lactate dehydrogenase (cytochrome)